ncbi:hypothetical protein KUCAC02_009505%2C partial [Xyrichtys novacula]|uniref:Uncharacterized protein n=1 Tax=Xyrichtys novacula TaxID=13765 RepID=A0AAV1G990_XYRNO|nr:hypothetical protein KUCAC02_009505%2C partial [Xyrichtys novacula]
MQRRHLQEHLDWLKEQGSPQRRFLPSPRFSPVSGARGAVHAHTAYTHSPTRVERCRDTERDSPEDFDFFMVCGTTRSMNLPSGHRSTSQDKPSEALRGKANRRRF